MAQQDANIKIHTEVDQSGLDKGLKEVHSKVKHTTEEGSSMFKEMFEALGVEKLVEKGLEVVTDFFKESIKGAKEAEVNTVQLKNSLENLGAAGDFSEIIENSEELSKKFVVSKQDILKSTTALETYGKLTQKQIKDLEPVILNYSKKTSKSVSESTEDIIRGLEGQGRGLKTIGVELKSGGTTAQNYAQIIDQVGAKVDGAADAFNNTAAGRMNKFHITLKELQEDIGAKLLPALADLASSFTPLLEQIGPLVEHMMPLLTTSLKTIAPLFNTLGGVLADLASSFTTLLEQIGPLVGDMMPLLTTYLKTIATLFNTLGGVLIKVLKPVGEIAGVLIDSMNQLMPLLDPILSIFGDLVSQLLEGLVPAFKQLIQSITPIIQEILPILSSIMEDLSPIISIVVDVLSSLFKRASLVFNILNKIIKPLTELNKYFLDFVNKALQPVVDVVKKVVGWLDKLYDGVAKFLGLGDAKNKDEVKETIKETGEVAQETGKKIIQTDNKVDKNKEKLRKKQQAEAKKEESEAEKRRKKELDEQDKALKELDDLKHKYSDTDRERVAQSFDEDIKKYQDTGIKDEAIYNDILAKKAAALKEYDDAQEKDRKEKLAKQKQDEIDNNQSTIDYLDSQMEYNDNLRLKDRQNILDEENKLIKDNLDAKQKLEIDAANGNVDKILQIQQKYYGLRAKQDQDYKDKKKQLIADTAGYETKIATQLTSSLSSLNDLVFSIKDANLKKGSKAELQAAKEQFKISKAVQLTNAAISVISGEIAALTSISGIPDPFAKPYRIANAISVGIAGAANIAKIAATQFTGGSSNTSVSTPTTGSKTTIPNAGQILGIGSIKTPIGSQGLQYQKVIVTESDITRTQNKVAVTQNRTKF